MATLTPLLLDDARRLGAAYGLDVASVRGIPAGSVNSNYALGLASGGQVFLRVYEEQQAASAAGEARLLAHLAAEGVKTPRPRPLVGDDAEGGFIAEHAGKPVAVFPWIEGDSLCQKRVTPDAARKLGAGAGRGPLRRRLVRGRAGVTLRRAAARRAPAPPRGHAARRGARLRGGAPRRRSPSPRLAPRRRRGLIHGDLFRDNVLWQGSDASPRSSISRAPRAGAAPFDLDGHDPRLVLRRRARSRASARALGRRATPRVAPARPRQRAARLYDEGCFAALRFTITRITDFELRPRGSGVFKDYRRFLARAATLDALGPRGLRSFLGV